MNSFLPLNAGVQYFLNKSFITRLIWFLLVILALAGSANFARKIFTSWQVVFVLGLLLLLLSQLTTLFLAAPSALGLPWSITVHLHCYGFKAFRPSRPNPNLAKLMGRKHDLTNKKTTTKTNTNTKTMTMTNTFKEHLQRAIFEIFGLETFDQSDEKT